jgi:hypothetical protein
MSGNDERVLQEFNWNHGQRVNKAVQMIRDGRTDEEIVWFFRRMVDFSEEETRRQIAILRRTVTGNNVVNLT